MSVVTCFNTKQSNTLSAASLYPPCFTCLLHIAFCTSKKALPLHNIQKVTQRGDASVVSGAAQHYYLPNVARQHSAVCTQPSEPDDPDIPVSDIRT